MVMNLRENQSVQGTGGRKVSCEGLEGGKGRECEIIMF